MNGKTAKVSYNVGENDRVKIKDFPVVKTKFKHEDVKLDILYEDKSCMVIYKPPGVVVHPSKGHEDGTIVNAVLKKLVGQVGSSERPGIVHRLDKDTSGILLVAKTQSGYLNLIKQFEKRTVEKSYLTLVSGNLKHKAGVIEAPIGRSFSDRKKMSVRLEGHGKNAVSQYKALKSYKLDGAIVHLLEVRILTGRTHQIRVHMSAIGNPVVGDAVYGKRIVNRLFAAQFGLKRQFLHAAKMKFVSPDIKKDVLIESRLPKDLEKVLKNVEATVKQK